MTLKEMKRDFILKVLEKNSGNRTRTSKSLGISIRCLRSNLAIYRREGFEVCKPAGNVKLQKSSS